MEIYPANLNAEVSLVISVRSQTLAAMRAAHMVLACHKKNVLTELGKGPNQRLF